MQTIDSDHIIMHYGTKRHSGRYPYGSGENPFQHESRFLSYVKQCRRNGMSDKEIAQELNMTSSEFRSKITISREEQIAAYRTEALRLKAKGWSNVAIGERIGKNESYVRSLLSDSTKKNQQITLNTMDALKKSVEESKFVDVGKSVNLWMGVSETTLKAALNGLKEEGYEIHNLYVEQLGTEAGNKTTIKVLCPPGTTVSELVKNRKDVSLPIGYSNDKGESFVTLTPSKKNVKSVNGDRVYIRYGDEGGTDKDGMIELRPGLADLSLGEARYAQVRIGVNDTHYLKGVAMYGDNIPRGYDVVYNTNKPSGTPFNDVLKKMTDDPHNVFGATVKMRTYIDADGNEKTSPICTVYEEGDWNTWSKKISAQMLSKQRPAIAKERLDATISEKQSELKEILALTNPVVKERFLKSFADDCDSNAVHLRASAFPGQASKLILSFPDIPKDQIYAPDHENGTPVVLIRFPHGGIFEIPELTVNNKLPTPSKNIPNAIDAVGIHPSVAAVLSGADFDGDTVLVIPNKSGAIKRSSPLEGLKNFDPKEMYKGYDGMKVMSKENTQKQMGVISNLITDMTIKGADPDELCRAVRHSMVVIDANKHKLDYKASERDNGIQELKNRYQGGGGTSTLLSRAKSTVRVPERREGYLPDPVTGERIYYETGATYIDKKGNVKPKLTKVSKMSLTKDARSLSSGTKIENIYADFANSLKNMANSARKEMFKVGEIKKSASAAKIYEKQVASLEEKLEIALKNSPLERKAQILGNEIYLSRLEENPNAEYNNAELQRIKAQSLAEARVRTGAHKSLINIEADEWEAIQAGAISKTKLSEIINNTNLDVLKVLATPKNSQTLTIAQLSRAKAMLDLGKTQQEVASALGVSVSTLMRLVKGE